MSSIPYSRYVVYPIPWYSFLILLGAALAIALAVREEKRLGLPKDTIIDLALWVLPFGIIGARLYYVIFSWDQFRHDPLSVFRIWEGGLAIYGGIIAGFLVLTVFSRRRRLSLLQLCDIIVPGLALAQAIGRWGNWFNMEAYGWEVTRESLCFFPFAVQIPADGYTWHLATFFYESLWNLAIFFFLIRARSRFLHRRGDVFFFYLLLYAAGRLLIEELRLDSLYTGNAVRVSQLLSILICALVLGRGFLITGKEGTLTGFLRFVSLPMTLFDLILLLLFALSGGYALPEWLRAHPVLFLSVSSAFLICCLFQLYHSTSVREAHDAHDQI